MIKTTDELILQLNNYANPNTKIARMEKNKELYKIKKGFYETDINTNPFYLTNILYGPSYISFQKALGYYGLIPERVYQITCATAGKHKSKEYTNVFGTFTYKDVPINVFSYGIDKIEENGYAYFIASKEKAICDMIYEYSPVGSIKELEMLLFEDLRIDEEAFYSLDLDKMQQISTLYNTKNHKLLNGLLRRRLK